MNFAGARDFVVRYLNENLDKRLYYHNLWHTLDVVESAGRLSEMEQVTPHDTLLIQTAALYHDTGMIKSYEGHEEVSSLVAKDTLAKFEYNTDEIEAISFLILATKFPNSVVSLHEMILCDADLDYLGREDYLVRSFQLKLEWKEIGFMKTGINEWLIYERNFLDAHQFYTSSARHLRAEGKKKNRNIVEMLIQE
jgi:hypothetical protein